MKLVYCLMTWNRLSEVITCVRLVRPYVDRVVVVDGGSDDDTIFYLKNRGDVEVYIYPWMDNFSEQRNRYLEKVAEGDWVLVSDPDEIFAVQTLKELPNLVKQGDNEGIDMFGFRCISVTMKGDEVVHQNVDDYWKGLFFRKKQNTRYINSPHETLVYGNSVGYSMVRTNLYYYHVKQENVIWKRGARNFFIGGGGPNLGSRNSSWVVFRKIVSDKTGIETWDHFHTYLLKGNIDEDVKKWIIEHRHEEGYDGSSEVRELYKLYFRVYHSEEEPEELRNEFIK